MKIYTKQGDEGETGLVGGSRTDKDDARIEAYGTVDELCATLGVARSSPLAAKIEPILAEVQRDLFSLGAELASPDSAAEPRIQQQHVKRLEEWIDRWDSELPALKNFILPGGTPSAGSLHLARVVCRRAERRVVSLARNADLSSGSGSLPEPLKRSPLCARSNRESPGRRARPDLDGR